MSLLPCPSCLRHVHVHEHTCPFCYASVDLPPLGARSGPTARLGRAALLALGTSAAALGACGRDETPKTDEPPAPPKPTDIPAPVYGGPPPMTVDAAPPAVDAATTPPTPTVTPKPIPTGHTMAPAYGGPPPNLK